MFDIRTVKQELGIDTRQDEKAESGEYPRAKGAKRANFGPRISTISTISTSTPSKTTFSHSGKKACFWQYKLDSKLPGFTQMGLMTSDPAEAQRQLTQIYGKPVVALHKKAKLLQPSEDYKNDL